MMRFRVLLRLQQDLDNIETIILDIVNKWGHSIYNLYSLMLLALLNL